MRGGQIRPTGDCRKCSAVSPSPCGDLPSRGATISGKAHIAPKIVRLVEAAARRRRKLLPYSMATPSRPWTSAKATSPKNQVGAVLHHPKRLPRGRSIGPDLLARREPDNHRRASIRISYELQLLLRMNGYSRPMTMHYHSDVSKSIINLSRAFDRLYWANRLRVSHQQLASAVRTVGPKVEDVMDHLLIEQSDRAGSEAKATSA
jgi:hypothetical protein